MIILNSIKILIKNQVKPKKLIPNISINNKIYKEFSVI